MKKLLLILLFVLVPSLAYADTASSVLTKDQACMENDGASMRRLQVFVNGKKSDTLYFYKQEDILYYIVPMFPYTIKDQGSTITYSASLFLYQYDCRKKESRLLSSQNLKKLLTPNSVFTIATPFDSTFVREFNFGQVLQVTDTEIFFYIGITQSVTAGSYSLNLKTKKFEKRIYIDEDWTLKNYKNYNKTYEEGDWRGVDIYYRGKMVHHFATCKGWGSKNQSDIDDFCGARINFHSVRNNGFIITLNYDYPGAPLENGYYEINPQGSIKNLKQFEES